MSKGAEPYLLLEQDTKLSILLAWETALIVSYLSSLVVPGSCLVQSGSSISRLLWRGAALTWIFHCVFTTCNGIALPQLHRNWGTLQEIHRWKREVSMAIPLWRVFAHITSLLSMEFLSLSSRCSPKWHKSRGMVGTPGTPAVRIENLKSCELKIWLSETRPRLNICRVSRSQRTEAAGKSSGLCFF